MNVALETATRGLDIQVRFATSLLIPEIVRGNCVVLRLPLKAPNPFSDFNFSKWAFTNSSPTCQTSSTRRIPLAISTLDRRGSNRRGIHLERQEPGSGPGDGGCLADKYEGAKRET